MLDKYRVDEVKGTRTGIQTKGGEMTAYQLRVTAKSTGLAEDTEILSKQKAYKIGDVFFAEREVNQYGTKLKRKPDPNGPQGASGGTPGQAASTSQPAQARGRMSYHDALRLYDRIGEDLKVAHDGGHVSTLFIAIMRGDIEPPSETQPQGQQPPAGDDGSW